MAGFVLVAGAFHGAWCWERVVPLLEARGHVVNAVELPGMGADRTPFAQLSFEDWVDAVVAAVDAAPHPVILVGHSRAGHVVSAVGERVPQAIDLAVYLAAVLLPGGASLADGAGLFADRGAPTPPMAPCEDGLSSRLDGPEIGALFYHMATPDWRDRALALLGPEPHFSFATPVALSEARFGQVRRAYVECLQDRTVPLPVQRAMQRSWPCGIVAAIESDHSPFYCVPEALAELFDGLAARAGARGAAG